MATVHKCDVCKKVIARQEGADVSVSEPYARFEFCNKHAAPVGAKKLQAHPGCMKKSDSQKLDTIITMLADIVDVFGKRFDKIDERFDKLDLRVDGVKSKVDGIERRLDTEAMARQDQKLPDRVARIEKHLGLDKTIAA